MSDQDKTREQLIAELAELRLRVAEQHTQLVRSQQAEADQRQINDRLPVLVATAGLDGYYKAVNTAFERILGWSEQESLSRPFLEFIHPEDRATAVETFAQLKAGSPAVNFLDRNICKDDSHRWISWIVIPVPARDIVFGIGQDVTERKQAEQALRESEERFRRIFDEGPLGVVLASLDARIQRVNLRFCDLLGYSEREIIALGIEGVSHPDDNRLDAQLAARLIAGEIPFYTIDKRFVRKDGQVIWGQVTVSLLRSAEGQPTHFIGMTEDISDRKQAEETLRKARDELERQVEERTAELRASKERFELVVRGAGVGIWDWDVRTGKVYYSSRWKMLFGYEENEIGDGFEDWARLLHPDERNRIIKFQEDFLAGTASTITTEFRLRHKDGSYRWIVGHGVVVRDEQGNAIRLVGSHGDITDRKLAEEEVKAEQRALRRMLVASDHERRLITYELHDGVAQQLLGALLLLASQEHTRSRKSEPAGAFRDGMDALRRAAAETRRLMNWLRTPVLDKFGLAEAIEDVAGQLRLRPDAPEIEYRHAVKFKRLEPMLENSLFRIAQEAMTNACRHSKSGKLRVKLTQKGDEVTLEVRDWGIGFDPSTVRENRFGLEGIRERTRILGGKLSTKSKPGQGTVIQATFPVIEATGDE